MKGLIYKQAAIDLVTDMEFMNDTAKAYYVTDENRMIDYRCPNCGAKMEGVEE